MRENRQSGSEGGGTEPNRFSLPLLKTNLGTSADSDFWFTHLSS